MILLDGDKNREIAVGNGHISEENLTYALSHYSHLNNDFAQYPNMEELLRGKLGGALIQNQGSDIKVYLARTNPMAGPYNSNGTYEILAVIVVNGRVTEKIDHINPLDVKSIKVLKGSDANIYHKSGSANQSYGSINVLGAILIETK